MVVEKKRAIETSSSPFRTLTLCDRSSACAEERAQATARRSRGACRRILNASFASAKAQPFSMLSKEQKRNEEMTIVSSLRLTFKREKKRKSETQTREAGEQLSHFIRQILNNMRAAYSQLLASGTQIEE